MDLVTLNVYSQQIGAVYCQLLLTVPLFIHT